MIVTSLSIVTARIIAAITISDTLSIISAIVSALILIGGFVTFVLGKDADKKKVVGFGALICAVVFFVGFLGLRSLNPPQHEWKQVVKKFDPGCRDGSWKIFGDRAAFSCPGNGLLVQQPTKYIGAEIDLENVNGSTYSQTMFKVQVKAKFPSSDGQIIGDPSTLAYLIVQTSPGAVGGGYTFGLNNTGYWELKSVGTKGNVIKESGSAQIDRSKRIQLEVTVQDNKLTSSINGQQIVEWDDSLNPSSAVVGLVAVWSLTSIPA